MISDDVLSAVPGTIRNAWRIVSLTRRPGGIHMPRGQTCPLDCHCGKHPEGRLSPEEQAERKRSQAAKRSRESQARKRAERPLKRQGKACPPGCDCKRHNSADWEYGNRSAAQRRWALEHPLTPEQQRVIRERHLYGLAPNGRAKRIEEQSRCCYLCGEPLDLDNPRMIHVDHDHSCCRGARSCGSCIRGIACHSCNKGIGNFGDDPDRMERVAARLRAANAEVASRRMAQEEVPVNVRRLERRKEVSLAWQSRAWDTGSILSRSRRGR